jgi:hypothetical protein
MKKDIHNCIHTLKDTWHSGSQVNQLSVQTKLDGFFKPALLRTKTSKTSEPSIDEYISSIFIVFKIKALQ